jgi:hypothetical protein
MIRRAGLHRFALALPPTTDYIHRNNILSHQTVGRWPTFLLPEDLVTSGAAGHGLKGGNG